MKPIAKIKAGALQFVLFIGTVIAVLLLSFVLVSHSHHLFHQKTDVLLTLFQSAESALIQTLNKPLSEGESIYEKDTSPLNALVSVQQDYWGIFEKRSAKVQHGAKEVQKWALVGAAKEPLSALYLKDRERPLILAGNAKITGNAYLPEMGVKMGNIYGHAYHRSQLVYGATLKSQKTMPAWHSSIQRQLEELTLRFAEDGTQLTYTPNMKAKNSFGEETQVVRGHTLWLNEAQLAGNIVLWAQHKIIVEAEAQLQDVILLAPEIEIKDWVRGYFQAIATERISVGKKCELKYPTALVVHAKKTMEEGANTPTIYVDSYADIRGVVSYLSNPGETAKPIPQVKIDEHARITGELYCTQNLELKGRVTGNVSTAAFIALENGSAYMNHLYNGQINSTTLPKAYGGWLGAGAQNKKIMKWLY